MASLVDLRELPEALRKSAPFAWSTDPQFVFAVGQRIFTPADLERAIPDRRDRPYAGWLYFMTELRVRSGSVVDHLLVNIGVVGPAAGGEQLQNTFHRLIRKDSAHGWDLQLGDDVSRVSGHRAIVDRFARLLVRRRKDRNRPR